MGTPVEGPKPREVQIYNTLTRTKERFRPREPGKAAVYFCGPTVYAETHLGHLRPALTGDLIVRFLRHLGYEVTYIVNFTDVDDKLIRRSAETGVSVADLASRYSGEYLQVMKALRVDQVSRYVRVTEHMDAIIAMIRRLVETGKAYVAGGDVYYDVRLKEDYGKLSGRSIEELMAGARIAVDERKRHPADFALWKAAKPGEPSWPSPWGEGRPGWHIECSALSLHYLGDGFDIHGGGDDLIFPHHENEIAQSEAFTGQEPFVRYWVHNGMIQVDAEKMSKSLGNFITAAQLLEEASPSAVRLYLYSTHYRNPLSYSAEGLAEAERAFARLARSYREWQELLNPSGAPAAAAAALSAPEPEAAAGAAGTPEMPGTAGTPGTHSLDDRRLAAAVEPAYERFIASLADDFHSARAVGALFDLVRGVNGIVHDAGFDPIRSRTGLIKALERFETMLGLLGLDPAEGLPLDRREGADEAKLLELLIGLRQEARSARNWELADRIRDGLARIGYELEDTPQGTRWRRRSP